MITIRSLLPVLVAVSLTGMSAAAQKNQKKAPEPRAEPMTEAAALAILGSDADVHAKAQACQELASAGTVKSVPALAALLNHEHLADYARSGLENISDASAGKALLKALPRLEGRNLSGVVNSLGVRREKAAVPELRTLALDGKRGVSAEAVASLGMIGTADAAKTLQQMLASGPADLRVPVAHASIIAAEHLAKEGNPAAARSLLDAVVRAVPSGPVATVAKNQTAALRAKR